MGENCYPNYQIPNEYVINVTLRNVKSFKRVSLQFADFQGASKAMLSLPNYTLQSHLRICAEIDAEKCICFARIDELNFYLQFIRQNVAYSRRNECTISNYSDIEINVSENTEPR